MEMHLIVRASLFIIIVATVLSLAYRKLWVRLPCVALVLVATALAGFQLWFAAGIVVYRFQSEIKPGTHASYGQWFVHDVISDTLPIFIVSAFGLSAMAIIPIRETGGHARMALS